MRALVTGATGFVGPHLLAHLERPVVLSRNAHKARQSLAKFQVESYTWDPLAAPPAEAFEGIDTVFHLAGEPVAAGRWTAERKRLIRESRVQGTRHLVGVLRAMEHRPRVLVCASAVGYYGDRGEEVLTEASAPGNDFLAEVCVAWEREAQAAAELGIRVVCVRIGIVLGQGGGALGKMLTPFKLGVGGPLGSGKQWMPWIHIDDLAAMFLHAAEHSEISGSMNGAAPNAVTNKEFTKALGAAVHRPAFLPAPYLALRLVFGQFADVLFASQRVAPQVAQRTGFEFQHPMIGPALEAIVSGRETPALAETSPT